MYRIVQTNEYSRKEWCYDRPCRRSYLRRVRYQPGRILARCRTKAEIEDAKARVAEKYPLAKFKVEKALDRDLNINEYRRALERRGLPYVEPEPGERRRDALRRVLMGVRV